MADISKLKVGTTTYDIKDATARSQIASIIGGGVVFIGITTDELSEGSTTSSITLKDGGTTKTITAAKGNLTIYEIRSTSSNTATVDPTTFATKISASGKYFFNYTSAAWKYNGSAVTLADYGITLTGAAVEGDQIVVTYTAGTPGTATAIVQSAATGTKEFIWDGGCWRQLGAGSTLKALAFKDSASTTYTPAGTVSAPTFSGTAATLTGKVTAAGTVSQPTFTGSEASVAMDSYTPAGTVGTPTITVNTNTGPGGIVPQVVVDETNETLSLTEVKISATSDEPTFSGTAATLTGKVTAAGTVSQPTFTGSETSVAMDSYTPAGTIDTPTFSGTAATITVS